MDFSEALKIPISKSHAPLPGGSIVSSGPGVGSGHAVGAAEQGAGYVTEKLYMLLQLYLQNKGWNPSVELLQCFAELKDTPILPSAAYLQALASRVALDNQGRLVLRETGKIILPYEHFANAVMLKHMSGPHGLHLSIEATVRAVMDSYTIGRDSFGMEKEFIVEVVQSCPSPACRYYKGQLGVAPFMDQPSFGASGAGSGVAGGPPPPPPPAGGHLNSAEYLTHLQQQLGQQNAGLFELGANERDPSKALMGQVKHSKPIASPQHQQPHMNAALFQQQQQQQQQQQNRAIVPPKAPPFDGFSNLSAFDKQRISDGGAISQDKIIRAFSELMRNIAKMKTFIRPSMCKPYGKQSESLQKTLFDTIQLLQMLRNCLPAPHIPVS
uniref:DUF3736 domain-containing protein n=1 Tax=Anopheles maculatus TaxID=74869 RepID=A0A182T6A1_9DIPT